MKLFVKLTDNTLKHGKKIAYVTQSEQHITQFQYDLYNNYFDHYDYDKDGLLTWDEYFKSVCGIR